LKAFTAKYHTYNTTSGLYCIGTFKFNANATNSEIKICNKNYKVYKRRKILTFTDTCVLTYCQ